MPGGKCFALQYVFSSLNLFQSSIKIDFLLRHFPVYFTQMEMEIPVLGGVPKLYTPSTLNIDFLQWHTQLNVRGYKALMGTFWTL